MTRRIMTAAAWMALLLAAGGESWAGARVGDTAPELSGTAWAGGKVYKLSDLRGKAVVLYFFEEG